MTKRKSITHYKPLNVLMGDLLTQMRVEDVSIPVNPGTALIGAMALTLLDHRTRPETKTEELRKLAAIYKDLRNGEPGMKSNINLAQLKRIVRVIEEQAMELFG